MTIFRVADDEHVVAAARIEESDDEAEADLTDDIDPELAPDDGAEIGEDAADGEIGDWGRTRPKARKTERVAASSQTAG